MYIVALCSNGTLPDRVTAGVFENKAESARIWDWYERGVGFREESNDLRLQLDDARDSALSARQELDATRQRLELMETRAQELNREVVARGEWENASMERSRH